ncbi:MAG: ABC transporter substrate-binding protein [Alicyclobacillaceae bacterium]|nr:ABC transporter substrate-binding protein [Alicyclobacillaceae bacterium]
MAPRQNERQLVFLKPEFKNAVAINNPSISGPAYPFLYGMIQEKGMQGGKKFFLDLKKNGVQIFPKNGPTLKALLTGTVKACVIQDTALLQAELKGEPVKMVYSQSGVYALAGVLGIDKDGPNVSAAKKFVEFALSKAGQDVMRNPKNGGSDSYPSQRVEFKPFSALISYDTYFWCWSNPAMNISGFIFCYLLNFRRGKSRTNRRGSRALR